MKIIKIKRAEFSEYSNDFLNQNRISQDIKHLKRCREAFSNNRCSDEELFEITQSTLKRFGVLNNKRNPEILVQEVVDVLRSVNYEEDELTRCTRMCAFLEFKPFTECLKGLILAIIIMGGAQSCNVNVNIGGTQVIIEDNEQVILHTDEVNNVIEDNDIIMKKYFNLRFPIYVQRRKKRKRK